MLKSLEKLKYQLRDNIQQPNEEIIDSSSSSVMVLFHKQDESLEVLMIKRSAKLKYHSGEWAFPGGKFEISDDNLMETAYREVREEIGIQEKNITVWLRMYPVNTFTGYTIWPFIGMIKEFNKKHLQLNEDEVAEVISIPIRIFLDDNHKRDITSYKNNTFKKSPAFTYNGKIIWGASARIIGNIFNPLIKGV